MLKDKIYGMKYDVTDKMEKVPKENIERCEKRRTGIVYHVYIT